MPILKKARQMVTPTDSCGEPVVERVVDVEVRKDTSVHQHIGQVAVPYVGIIGLRVEDLLLFPIEQPKIAGTFPLCRLAVP